MSSSLKNKPNKQDIDILNCIRKTNEKGKPSHKGTPCGYPSSIWEIDRSKYCVNRCVDKILGPPKEEKKPFFYSSSQRKRDLEIAQFKIRNTNNQKRWANIIGRVNMGDIVEKPVKSDSKSEKYYSAKSHIDDSGSDIEIGGAKRQRRKTTKRQRRKTTKRQRRKTTKRQRCKTTKRQRRKTTKYKTRYI